MKWSRSGIISLVYGVFVLLFTIYIVTHPSYSRGHSGSRWGYLLEFLHISSYFYFILEGIVLGTKGWSWAWVVLLPGILFIGAIAIGYALVGLIRLGGGDLLNKDKPDMILLSMLLLTGTFFSVRILRPRKKR